MPGEDGDGVYARVAENVIDRGGGIGKAELPGRMLRMEAPGRGDPDQLDGAGSLYGWQERGFRKVACSYHAETHVGALSACRREFHLAVRRPLRRTVREQDPQGARTVLARDQAVGSRGFLNREAMRDQRFWIQLARGHQIHDGLKVAAFRPADLPDRIVVAAALRTMRRSAPGHRTAN